MGDPRREEAQGAPGAPQASQWPEKPPVGSKTTWKALHDLKVHQLRPQEARKQGHDRPEHALAALAASSLGGLATGRSAPGFDAPGASTPAPGAPHAWAASPDTTLLNHDAPPRSLPFSGPRVADACSQPHNDVPLNVRQRDDDQEPSVASPSDTHSGPDKAEAPLSAAQPMSAMLVETRSRPPNPATDADTAKVPTRDASSAEVPGTFLPNLTTPRLAAKDRASSDSGRQQGSPGPVHGPAASHSPIGQFSADSDHPSYSKPILKMKRTGQNFPISSPRPSSPLQALESLHQKKVHSLNTKTGLVKQRSSHFSKTSESPQIHGLGLPRVADEPGIDKSTGPGTAGRLSTNCRTNALEPRHRSADNRYSKWGVNLQPPCEGVDWETQGSSRCIIERNIDPRLQQNRGHPHRKPSYGSAHEGWASCCPCSR
jgi:hypothetical protein